MVRIADDKIPMSDFTPPHWDFMYLCILTKTCLFLRNLGEWHLSSGL